MDDPRRSFEFRLLNQFDKIRLIIVAFLVLVLYTAPRPTIIDLSTASLVVCIFAIYAVLTRFVLNWHRVRREGQVEVMAAFLVCTDIAFIGLFLWAMGPQYAGLTALLLIEVIFAATFFSRLEAALVLGIICACFVALALANPRPGAIWEACAGVGASIVVAWMAYALAEVTRRERATTDRIVRFLTEGVMLILGDGRIAVLNPRIEHIFGVRAKDLLGLNIHDPKNAQLLAPLEELLADVRNAPEGPSRVTTRNMHVEDPEPAELQCITVPCITESLEAAAWVVVCKDVTELLSAVRAREEGIVILSHELRGHVQALRASSEVLLGMADRLPPEVRDQALTLLDSETRRLTNLIGRVLDASAVRTGAAALQCDQVRLQDVAAVVAQGCRPNAQTKGITLTVEADPDVPPVNGDPVRLDQVIRNLVENAIKFCDAGAQVHVRVAAEDGTARVTVEDNGPGIPEGKQELIFEQFVHSPVRGDSADGIGLGLYLCREIVRHHHGTIEVDSRPGEGARFTVRLPCAPPGSDASQQGQEAVAQ